VVRLGLCTTLEEWNDAEPVAGPNDEERGQPRVASRTSVARSSSSVSFAFGAMTRMPLQRASRKQHPLIGSWVNGDEYATEVEYIISGKEPAFEVRAVDRYDGEVGEVHDVSYDDGTSTLSFAVYWSSTGRFVKARLVATAPNRVSYTYSFTENEMWFRKGTEPCAPPNRRPARQRKTRTRSEGGGR